MVIKFLYFLILGTRNVLHIVGTYTVIAVDVTSVVIVLVLETDVNIKIQSPEILYIIDNRDLIIILGLLFYIVLTSLDCLEQSVS